MKLIIKTDLESDIDLLARIADYIGCSVEVEESQSKPRVERVNVHFGPVTIEPMEGEEE